jgi:hypothetical protein
MPVLVDHGHPWPGRPLPPWPTTTPGEPYQPPQGRGRVRLADDVPLAARGLASEVDGLPLALEQAAAYILAAGDTLAGYVGLFQQRRADMLSRGEPAGYRGTVATTWALAFARLEQSAPGAAGLLRLLAFCAPEAILSRSKIGFVRLTWALSRRQAARMYSLMRPLRIGFRRIRCVSRSVTVMRGTSCRRPGMRWAMPWCGRAVL